MEGLSVPDFALVDQSGHPVDQSLFDGKITVLAFIFTNCRLACPPMTANMFRAYNQLDGTPVQFVSISVDPLHDTPEALTSYAANLSIDTQRWRFLTGEVGSTRELCARTLDFDISPDPDEANVITLSDGSLMQNIRHPTKLFLVGPDRQILDFCTPTVGEDLQRFIDLARKASE
ncbi:MAG: SCO family protein [Phycisphaerales bacterium]|nr:SCO family protein [Phycisphaerales bacterium]